MIGSEQPIAELLPHTGQMVLVDKLLSFSEHGLSAELTVRGDGLLFGDQQALPAWVGVEYMAQTIAAYVGLRAKQAGQPIRLGFLLGTRHYASNVGTLPVGTQLTVKVEKILQDEQLGVFDCRIQGDNILITAKLNVYQPPLGSTSNQHE